MAQRGSKPPYTAPSDVATFFERLKNIGPPPKVTTDWIKAMNLASVQPEGVPGMVKWLGLADGSGVPHADVWNKVRVPGTRTATLQELVRSGYSKLFDSVDVEQGTREDIEGGFISVYGVGSPAKSVATFLAICQAAGIEIAAAKEATSTATTNTNSKPKQKRAAGSSGERKTPPNTSGSKDGVAVSVLLNVEIPADWSEEQIRERLAIVTKAAQGG